MSEQPDHIRAFRAALEAEGFEEGKIARVEQSDIMDIWWEGTVPCPPPNELAPGYTSEDHVTFYNTPSTPPPYTMADLVKDIEEAIRQHAAKESEPAGFCIVHAWTDGGLASPSKAPPPLSGIDKALAMAQAVLDALEAADAANPRPKPTESAQPSTEATPPGWMARIRRWIAEFGRFLAFRRAS